MSAFDLLFERYRGPVFNFIYRMLNRERHSAEDLLQEIFMRVDSSKDSYEIKARFSTWLFTIARNHCLNFLKSRHYTQAGDTVSLDYNNNLVAHHNQANSLEQKDFRSMLEKLISTLPARYREVFLLHVFEGFTHQEIAEILRTNPATVRSDYYRAKILINDKLAPALGRAKGDSTDELQ